MGFHAICYIDISIFSHSPILQSSLPKRSDKKFYLSAKISFDLKIEPLGKSMKNPYKKIIFGLKIKELRTGKGLSFAKLSQLTGMSISYLNEIEKGKKFPKPDKIKSLAKSLDVEEDKITSFDLNPALLPVGELLKSNFLNELPLDLFGIDMQKVVEIISKAPMRVGAFISTLVELSKNYALQEENFYFGAMRAYQELHYNYFEEIELNVDEFLKGNTLPEEELDAEKLERILLEKYKCKIDTHTISDFPELRNVHSVFIPKKNKLLIHKDVNEKQKSFLLGREIGYRYLDLKNRPYYAPLRIPQSFDPVLSNFKATYFAATLMMNRNKVAKQVEKFCSREKWDGDALVEIINSYNVTPEMFVHRLTNILPRFFQLKQLFFIRVRTDIGTERYTIDKVLHLNQSHHPHSNKIYEHYCRRWGSIEVLKELHKKRIKGKTGLMAYAQRSKYFGTEDEYLTISIGIPAGPLQEKDISVTFGILMDNWLKKVIRFASDPNIPFRTVNKTCERCPILDCNERVARPYVHQQRQEWKATKDRLDELIKK